MDSHYFSNITTLLLYRLYSGFWNIFPKSGKMFGWALVWLIAFSGTINTAVGQAIQAGSGAPSQSFHVANGSRTFTVTVLGGAASSGSVKITLPTGYVMVGGSAVGSGLTATMTNVAGNVATVNLTGIPAAGTNATFTYQAFASCAAIGEQANQADYIFTPTGGTALQAVQSNAFNLLNARMNITNLANLPTAAGVVGDSYVRTYRINNNGFGNIDTVYVTDVSGIGVEHVSHSVSTTSNTDASSPSTNATVDVTLVSTTTTGNNTTYIYRFIISSTAQDDHLGQNEYFTFTQNLKIISCTDLNTSLNAWYGNGPNPQPCIGQNDTQTTALAVDNSKQPNLVFTRNPNPSTNAQQNNLQLTCRGVAKDQTFSFTNTGGAAAKNVKLRLFHGWGNPGIKETTNGAKQEQVGFVPGSFQYKIPGGSSTADDNYIAVPSTGSTGIRTENPHFYTEASCINTTAPAWLDMVIPELGAGETIYISYQDLNCCDGDCGGKLIFSTQVTHQYFNSCGVQIKNNIEGAGDVLRPGSGGNSNFFETFPTDMIAGQSYTLKWETTQSGLPIDVYPQGSSIRYQITLPPGMVWDGSPITMRTKNGSIATPTSFTYANNVINATFTTGQNNFTPQDYNNKAVFMIPGISVDCAAAAGASSGTVNTQWIYKSKDCTTCEERMICKDRTIAYHCPGGCDTGLLNDNFVIKRRTYGNPDNLNNGTPNGATLSSNVRTDWVSRGDLLDFTFSGTIKDAGATTHNFKFAYAKFTIPDVTKTHFTGVSATVKITSADGSVVKADLANYPLIYTPSTGVALVDFSASNLAAAGVSNYTQFVDSDKITVMITLKVTDGIGGMLATTVVSTDFYLSDAANADGTNTADKYACGNFAGAYTLLGVLVPIRNPVIFNVSECGTIKSIGSGGFNVGQHINNGGPGTNYYMDEYRQMGTPGNYTFTMPVGYELDSMSFIYTRNTSNYNGIAFRASNVAPTNVSGQVYTYDIRKLFTDQGGSWMLPDEGFSINFEAFLRPTCEAPTTARMDYSLVIIPGTQMTETFPVNKFTVGSYNTFNLTKTNLVVNANAPIKTVTGNTVSWDVQIANTQPGTTPKVWMGENNTPTNGVTIQKVEPITGFGGTVNGAAIAANSTGMYELGNYVQESKYYRVTATFTNCGQDILPLAIGYVCGNYPASMAAASCKILNNLTVIPTDGNLQVSLIGQPAPTYPDAPGSPTGTVDLCQELQYTAEVKNPAQGTAYDLTFTVKKPTGMSYIANSYQLSHTILPASATLSNVNNDGAYVVETPTTLTFTIPASAVANLPYNDGYTIRYKVKTNACDFVSGTKMTLQALGKNGCGSPIVGTQQQTQTIRLQGENANPNSYTITSSISADIESCSNNPVLPTYTFSAKNEGPVATYAGETLRIIIPSPYKLGAITNVSNFGAFGAPAEAPTTDGTSYTWTVPAGIAAGQTISFTAPLTLVSGVTTSSLTCGASAAIHELMAYKFTSTCVPSGPTCSGSLQAEGENEATTINVVKPGLSITAVTVAQPAPGQLTGTITVANSNATSTAGLPQNGTLKIYQDTNLNGVIDAADVLAGSQTITIGAGATQTINYSMTSNFTGQLCPALVELTVACACTNPVITKLACDVLPVKLISFNVNKVDNGVSLTWETSSETNSDHFEVQRSADAKNWKNVTQVSAQGESSQIARYATVDLSPASGTNYYRLKMVDRDNSFAYSSIKSILVDGKGALVYPNPFDDRLNLSNIDLSKVLKIEVINVQGVSVMKLNKPKNQYITSDKLIPGTYIIKITYVNGESVQQKVIKK